VIKKIITALVVITIAGAALFAGVIWKASQGISPAVLEAKYMTSVDRFVEVNGARVRVREEGPEGAPVLLLIHGFTFSLESWDAWAEIFGNDYRIIRYDLLGHGLTGPDPEKRYAPEERAAFIGDVMDALELDSAVIAGNSLGGLAAWRFAANNPERVSALIMISPGAYPYAGLGDEPVPIPAAMKTYLLTAPEAGVRISAERIFGDDTKITERRLEILRDLIRRKGNGAAMINSLEEFTLPDPTEMLAKVAAPTLILWGADDIIIPPEQGNRLVDDIPDALLITYPGVGHAAQEEAPEETAADTAAFLNGLTSPPQTDSE
jgi:pimeloyl-ACP methyl ester carboxylesterase